MHVYVISDSSQETYVPYNLVHQEQFGPRKFRNMYEIGNPGSL